MTLRFKPENVFKDEDEFTQHMEENPDLWNNFLQQVVWKKEMHHLRTALYDITQSDNIATAERALLQLECSLERCPSEAWRRLAIQRRDSIEKVKSAFPARKVV